MTEPDPGEPVPYPIDGVLDLHMFRPADVPDLLDDYLAECRAAGLLEVRIIHGKGTGALRRLVHSRLARRSDVVEYRLAGDASGWGATCVSLLPEDDQLRSPSP